MFVTNLFFKLKELSENSPAKRDKIIITSLVSSLFFVVLSGVIIPIVFWQTKEFVILKYNIYFGISSLGPWYQLWLLPLYGLLFLIADYFLAFKYFLRYHLLTYFLVISGLAINLILFISLLLIIYINS